ncbi:hypothetical protein B857_01612 [Solibacillus isronensis B3W22]|uniref:Uncharacterized protein n=1 Tax=Solibacillus isronensis B3W22 TaxID=1224748 RepID=K1KT34_9BACL|nr:hypothetical protein [Solibacillus isronensis]AMO86755.1 hypothetical protein SOLI23_14610 [Solibacillus silvestris]EKB45661.1 hypothetical protein B857_01612 [Solibacillus isronensis B3W22]
MKKLLLLILVSLLIAAIEFGKSFDAIVLPISASLILLIGSITVWRIAFGTYVEKKYTVLFLGVVSLYTIGTIFNVLMYN